MRVKRCAVVSSRVLMSLWTLYGSCISNVKGHVRLHPEAIWARLLLLLLLLLLFVPRASRLASLSLLCCRVKLIGAFSTLQLSIIRPLMNVTGQFIVHRCLLHVCIQPAVTPNKAQGIMGNVGSLFQEQKAKCILASVASLPFGLCLLSLVLGWET